MVKNPFCLGKDLSQSSGLTLPGKERNKELRLGNADGNQQASDDERFTHPLLTQRLPLAFFCKCVEVRTARIQHTFADQFIDGIEHALPFRRLVACRLE